MATFFKTGFRALRREKEYTFLNIFGLAIGITASILILLFVHDERSYDRFYQNPEEILRINLNYLDEDGSIKMGFTSASPSYIPHLHSFFPEIKASVLMLHVTEELTFSVNELYHSKPEYFFAGKEFFDVFGSDLLLFGDPVTALDGNWSVVLTESSAIQIFGRANVVGQTLSMRDIDAKITGVMRDFPRQTHAHFDYLFSIKSLKEASPAWYERQFESGQFSDNITQTYVRLHPGTNVADMQKRIPEFMDKTLGTWENRDGEIQRGSDYIQLQFMPVTDIHLRSHQRNELEPTGNVTHVTFYIVLAAFILLIACFNFVNLATARATRRAREVGMRKVIGAHRSQLVRQFFGESTIIVSVSFVLGLILAEITLPWFNQFIGRPLSLSIAANLSGFLFAGGLFLLVSVVAGFYPAFYLSAYSPGVVLRGELTRGLKGSRFRHFLVVFQFTISVVLIAAVSIVQHQMNFLNATDLGFDRDRIVTINGDHTIRKNWNSFRDEVLALKNVEAVTISKSIPSEMLTDSPGFKTVVYGKQKENSFGLPCLKTEHGFASTYGLDIIAGRDMSTHFPTDSSEAYLINQSACLAFGWKQPEDAVGAPITYNGRDGHIVGVVNDFHFESLHHAITPLILYTNVNEGATISARINRANVQETIASLNRIWRTYHNDVDMTYSFLDDQWNSVYQNEQRMVELFEIFSVLAIVIACLGLVGLSAYSVDKRSKEISIRKTLGASSADIIRLMSREFGVLVGVAIVVATPIVWYVMSTWLDRFSYRIGLTAAPFVIAAVIVGVLAMVAVLPLSWRAAVVNPSKALRRES